MTFVAPTFTNFLQRFTEFQGVPSEIVTAVLDEALGEVDASWGDADRRTAGLYLTAHMLALEGWPGRMNGGSSPAEMAITGGVLREKVGDVEVQYAGATAKNAAERYALTSYGQRYLDLLKRKPAGRVHRLMGFFARVVRRLRGAEKITPPTSRRSIVKVGFPAGQSKQSLIMRAVWNEFGTKGSGKPFKTERGGGFGGPIPERPFFRNAMRSKRDGYRNIMKEQGIKILRGETTPKPILSKLGVLAQGDVQSSITAFISPPNSPTTIRLKKSSKPLIDTGEMRQAVTYKVEE